MESHEIIKKAFERTSPKQVASDMGLSLSMVYKWSQSPTESGSGSRNPVDRVNQLRELTGDNNIVQWLCAKAGGFFVRNPPSYCEDGYAVIPATTEIVNQFAGLLNTISKAAEDNSITDDESEEIREVWENLKRFTEGFVKCCEEGDFSQLPGDKPKRLN